MLSGLDTTKNDAYYVDADILVTKHKNELLFWGCLVGHCTEKTLLQSGYIRRCRDLHEVVELYPEPVPFGMDSLTRLPYKKETIYTRNSYQNHCYSSGTGGCRAVAGSLPWTYHLRRIYNLALP